VLPEDEGGSKVLPMPRGYALEMYCDWIGAGRAQGVTDWWNPRRWYDINKHKMQVHVQTAELVESFMLADEMQHQEGSA
jgi:hypothetical protein